MPLRWIPMLLAFVTLVTPSLVVAIVLARARAEAAVLGRAVGEDRSLRVQMWVATGIAVLALAVWFLVDREGFARNARAPELAIAELLAFLALAVFFALPSLRQIEREAAAALESLEGEDPVRHASLVSRSPWSYLKGPRRMLPGVLAAVGLASLALRLGAPSGERRILVPLGFAFAAVVLLFLYETWLREETRSPQRLTCPEEEPRAEGIRGRRLRAIQAAELLLVALLLGLAHLLLDVDWASPAGRLVAAGGTLLGALVGIAGCALAISSQWRANAISATVVARD